jgi:hypothetical protein
MEKAKVSALDFFMYLGSIVLLYTVVGTLISFVFDLIDYLLPDRLTDRSYYSSFYSSGVRFDIAMLIVLTPALIALIMFINRGIRANMAKMELWVRKWSTFLTLFIGTGPPTSLEGVGIELIVASSSRSSTVRENIANVLNAELAGMARDQKFIVSRPIGQVLTPPVPSIPPSRLLPRSRPGRSP